MEAYYLKSEHLGATLMDVLHRATEVRIDGGWWPVINYDEQYDLLCYLDITGESELKWSEAFVGEASVSIAPEDIRVGGEVLVRTQEDL